MSRFAFIGAALALLAAATVTIAASPSPAPAASPAASPRATAHPTPSPSPAAAPSSGSTTTAPVKGAQTWSATVNPVDVTGNATVAQQADGTGVMTLQLTGLVNEAHWTVDIQAGTIEMPSARVRIALKQGDEVTKTAPDTVTVKLTKDEMKAFAKAQTSIGVVVFISDGSRLSAATFSSQ
jgi:hypothetical protein